MALLLGFTQQTRNVINNKGYKRRGGAGCMGAVSVFMINNKTVNIGWR